jgi:hypothetical protein
MDEPRNRPVEERFTTMQQSVTVEQLMQEAQCGICASILAAYHARAQHVPNVQLCPASKIGIEIAGPFYLDPGFLMFGSPGRLLPRHGDRSDPNHIVIGMFLRLNAKGLLLPRMENESTMPSITSRPPSRASQIDEFEASPTWFTITPQFKLTYSNGETKILTSIQEWEVPFFDVKLLGNWLKRCEDCHAGQCGGKGAEKGKLTGHGINSRLLRRY